MTRMCSLWWKVYDSPKKADAAIEYPANSSMLRVTNPKTAPVSAIRMNTAMPTIKIPANTPQIQYSVSSARRNGFSPL